MYLLVDELPPAHVNLRLSKARNGQVKRTRDASEYRDPRGMFRWLNVQKRGLPVDLSPAWKACLAKYPHETCTLFGAQTDALSGLLKFPALRSRRAATV